LIDAVFDKPEDLERRNAWYEIVEKYIPAMEVL
jgi:hypothetical protein